MRWAFAIVTFIPMVVWSIVTPVLIFIIGMVLLGGKRVGVNYFDSFGNWLTPRLKRINAWYADGLPK